MQSIAAKPLSQFDDDLPRATKDACAFEAQVLAVPDMGARAAQHPGKRDAPERSPTERLADAALGLHAGTIPRTDLC